MTLRMERWGLRWSRLEGLKQRAEAQCAWVGVGGISGLPSPSKSPVSSLTGSDANLNPPGNPGDYRTASL